jgi:hypothetical protein
MRIVRLVRGFGHLGLEDQARFVVAWSLLGVTRLMILVLPFTAVRRMLGEGRSHEGPTPELVLDDDDRIRAARLGVIVQAAARHTPWRSDCYPQALTARLLLGVAKVPHVISFGLRRDSGRLVAHAWVHAGGVPVTGGSARDYTEVGSFCWVPRTRHGG